MPLIEGFGDEVTLLLFAFLAGVIIVLAWMSTQVDSRFLVPIIILDRERFSALMQRLRGIAEQRFAMDDQMNETGPQSESTNDNTEQNSANNATEANPENVSSLSQNLEADVQLLDSQPEPDCRGIERSTGADDDTTDDQAQTEFDDKKNEHRSHSSVPDDTSDIITHPEIDSVSMPLNEPETSSPSGNLGTSDQVESNEFASGTPEGHIQVRLQYVDGRQRLVYAKPDDTVRDFKRNHFASELAGHLIVRFVMSGQELRNDDLTLRSYRVSDGSVIHCLITPARVDPVVPPVDTRHFDIGFLMLPLFGFLLTLLWYARIAYRSYFSGASTCSLVAISFLYLVAVVGSFRSHRLNHPHQE